MKFKMAAAAILNLLFLSIVGQRWALYTTCSPHFNSKLRQNGWRWTKTTCV